MVKASAQLRVSASGEAGLETAGCGGGRTLLRVVSGTGALRDMQQPPSAPLPPQQPPPDGVPLADREAASVLQNSVLRGSARHWAQVPGPLAHGLVAWPIGGRVTSERASPSEGGGVNCERDWIGARRLFSKELRRPRSCSCAAISAQMQGVPSVQNPQGSTGGDEVSVLLASSLEPICAGTPANRDVKSISISSGSGLILGSAFSGSGLPTPCGGCLERVDSCVSIGMAKASSMHWQCVEEQLEHPTGTFSVPPSLLRSALVATTSSIPELRVEGRARGGRGTESGIAEDLLLFDPDREVRNSLTRASFALRSIETSFSRE